MFQQYKDCPEKKEHQVRNIIYQKIYSNKSFSIGLPGLKGDRGEKGKNSFHNFTYR